MVFVNKTKRLMIRIHFDLEFNFITKNIIRFEFPTVTDFSSVATVISKFSPDEHFVSTFEPAHSYLDNMELHRLAIFSFISLLIALAASLLLSINNNGGLSIIVQNNYPSPKNHKFSAKNTGSQLISVINEFKNVTRELRNQLNAGSPVCTPNLELKSKKTYNFTKPKTWNNIITKYSAVLSNQDPNYEIKHSNGKNYYVEFRPKHCKPSQCIAILIPARNRDVSLRNTLYKLPHTLTNQFACFGIYVLDQYNSNSVFNKGKIYNSGVLEARKDKEWDCYAFHDFDSASENDYVQFECLEGSQIKNGTSFLNETIIQKINGWSNTFWGSESGLNEDSVKIH